MIDHEKQIYTLVSNALKDNFDKLQTTNQKLKFYNSTYPAVSLLQTNNYILNEECRYDENENVCVEEYEIEIQSAKDMQEIKRIMYIADKAMHQLGYFRTYCGLDITDETTELKRLMRYKSI